jgi:hypothetical protein
MGLNPGYLLKSFLPYLVGVETSQCDLNICDRCSRTKIIIGYGANCALQAKIKHDSAPLGNFLANGFISRPAKVKKYEKYKEEGQQLGTFFLREHSHMTSDVLGVFLFYLPTTYHNQIL